MLAKQSKTYLFAVSAACLIAAISLILQNKQEASDYAKSVTQIDPVSVDISKTIDLIGSESAVEVRIDEQASAPVANETNFQLVLDEIATRLLNNHAHEITDLAFQVSLIELRNDLLIDYPSDGLRLFEAILRQAFPKLAESILALLEKKDIYDDWLLNQMIELNKMSLLEQKEVLWTKRYEIFGKEAAEQIWEPEKSEKEERVDAVHSVLSMLNHSKDVAMHDRVYLLKSAYEENYLGTVEDLVLDSSGVLAQTIFSLDAVQKELSAMPSDQRQGQINAVRRQLGFNESQIEWLAKRDQEREKRWLNGYAYMEARSKLEELYAGETLAEQLDLLREKHFKDEASTIKKEEEQIGFFRFSRDRVYGRN